jgi:hypothetical protein
VRFVQAGRRIGIERVGIGKVLVDTVPWVAPIVVDVTAQLMPADAPDVVVPLGLQMVVPDHHVVDVLDLEREVIKPGLFAPDAEEDVMVDIDIAAIDSVERADHIARVAA